MSVIIEKKKTAENKVIMDKDNQPEFKIGSGIFRERPKRLFGIIPRFWRKHDWVIYCDGSPNVFHLGVGNPEPPALSPEFGTKADLTKFVRKVVAKAKAEQKPIKTWQFLMLLVLAGINLGFTILVMRWIGVF